MVKEEAHLQENALFDLDPEPKVEVTQNDAKLLLHYVINAPAKFAVATSDGLGGVAFTRNLMEGGTDRRMTDTIW